MVVRQLLQSHQFFRIENSSRKYLFDKIKKNWQIFFMSFLKSFHTNWGNSEYAWFISAFSLISAIKIIDDETKKIESSNIFSDTPYSYWAIEPSFMLKGYAIECLFKSIWLMNGNMFIEDGKIDNT